MAIMTESGGNKAKEEGKLAHVCGGRPRSSLISRSKQGVGSVIVVCTRTRICQFCVGGIWPRSTRCGCIDNAWAVCFQYI